MQQAPRFARLMVLLSALLLAAGHGCARKIVHMGPPHDRYDHNRTRLLVSQGLGGEAETRLVDGIYAPRGLLRAQRAHHKPPIPSLDDLPAANVVPLFTGLPLPLSDEPVADGRSDRRDLIDFLSEGPNAQVGVEPGETMGGRKETEARYRPVLEMLSSLELLGGGRRGIVRWASRLAVEFADAVVDSRYRMRAFDEVVALRYQDFWFVLYSLPGNDRFTRLVVIPKKIGRQEFLKKAP